MSMRWILWLYPLLFSNGCVITQQLHKHLEVTYSNEIISGFFTQTQVFTTAHSVEVDKCVFYECNSLVKSGGAISYVTSYGNLKIENTAFSKCSSNLQSGGVDFSGSTVKLSSSCFINCSAVSDDAFSFYCSSTLTASNEVCVVYCSPSTNVQNGPSAELKGEKGSIRGANFSCNSENLRQITGVLMFSTNLVSQLTYSNLFNNSACYAFSSSSKKTEISYCNFLDNTYVNSVFGLVNCMLNLNYGVVRGNPKLLYPQISNLVTLTGSSSQLFAYGCQITYYRTNSSQIVGNSQQFGKAIVITLSLPTFGERECAQIIGTLQKDDINGITFPDSLNNIIAMILVGIILAAGVIIAIYLECFSYNTLKLSQPDLVTSQQIGSEIIKA